MKLLLVLVLSLAMTGCASITMGEKHEMKVETFTPTGQTVTGTRRVITGNNESVALPPVGDTAKSAYAEWLTKPAPKAFAVSERGNWAAAWGNRVEDATQAADPVERALWACSRRSAVRCKLYEVDDKVAAADAAPSVAPLGGTLAGVDLVEWAQGASAEGDFDIKNVKLRDDSKVPFLAARGRQDYLTWVGWHTPKAFAVAPNGGWYAAQGNSTLDPAVPNDPSLRALALCEQRAKVACKLYAVDDAIVWGQAQAALPAKK